MQNTPGLDTQDYRKWLTRDSSRCMNCKKEVYPGWAHSCEASRLKTKLVTKKIHEELRIESCQIKAALSNEQIQITNAQQWINQTISMCYASQVQMLGRIDRHISGFLEQNQASGLSQHDNPGKQNQNQSKQKYKNASHGSPHYHQKVLEDQINFKRDNEDQIETLFSFHNLYEDDTSEFIIQPPWDENFQPSWSVSRNNGVIQEKSGYVPRKSDLFDVDEEE